MEKKIFIIDASNYIFRSYYAIRHMSNSKKVSTNAIYGFIRSIQKIQKDFSPEYMAVVFDGPRNKASRTAIYKDYKANREKAPDDLYPQIGFAKQYCEAFGLPVVEIDGFEADDAIGAVAKFAASNNMHAYLCSSDKDLCQLVDEKTSIIHTHKNNHQIDQKTVLDKYGITPEQFIDYLAIVGDTSDNIPGIKGFGPKTAAKLLQEYGSLGKILENTPSMKNIKRAQKIEEEKDNALMSYQLATIQTNLSIPKEITFYQEKKTTVEEKKEFLEEMEFSSLIKEIEKTPTVKQSDAKPMGNYTLIDDISSLKGVCKSLSKEASICITVAQSWKNPMASECIAMAIGARKGVCYYIPFNASLSKKEILSEIDPLIHSGASFYGHDIKRTFHCLQNEGIAMTKIDFDTLLASYILDSHLSKHDLEHLVEKHFQTSLSPLKEILPKKKGATFASVSVSDGKTYLCTRLDYMIRLKELFQTEIEAKGFSTLFYEVELPLLPVLVKMERSGIFLNTSYLSSFHDELIKKLKTISTNIYEEAEEEFNINSPKQLSEILFTKLNLRKIKGTSTSADILQELKNDHPIIDQVLTYRTLEKLRSTYVDALAKEVNSETKRIHPTFNQSGTVTGRLSCSNPNLQNIPVRTTEGKKVRTAFIPEKKDWVFLSLDYSQIELRILAHLSGEQQLIDAFKQDKDIHKETAALVFDVPIEKVTKEMRYQAKAVNFGILYGQKAFGLAKELQIDIRSAKKIIDTYFEKYAKVKEYIDNTIERAKKEKKTISILGRERLLPDIDSKNFAIKAANERFAVNAPIQGSQADIIKIAMIEACKQIEQKNMKSSLILQVHDELIFECPENEVDACQQIVKKAMEEALILSIPLKVDVSIGKNWGEC